ncbi:MAG: hypothetical protein AAFQ90_12495 [Pseudomonadota bacterium]
MFLASLAFIPLASQVVVDVVVRNDNPETWVLEYPQRLQPYVSDYRDCLNRANRTTTGEPDFEMWHRSDLSRCEKERAQAVAKSNEVSGRSEEGLSEAEVEELFMKVESIHISRGRDLDDQLRERLAASAATTRKYENVKPKGLVLELRDANIVQSRAELEVADGKGAQGASDADAVTNTNTDMAID